VPEVTEISIVEIERMLKKKGHRSSFGKGGCADSEHLHDVNHGDGGQPVN
jgi:hypothetical protein